MNDAVFDFLFDIDPTGNVIRSEGKVLAHLGYAGDRIRGMRLLDMLEQTDGFMALEILESVSTDHTPLRTGLSILRNDGRTVFVDASFRPFLSSGRHVFTRMECLVTEAENYDDPLGMSGGVDDLDSVLAEVEAGLKAEEYDNPTMSVFSLETDDTAIDPEAIAQAADRMASTLALQAREKGRAFRSGERSVSVLHGDGFEREAAQAKVQEAVGPEISTGSFGVDLSDPGMDLHDKMALVDDMLSATDLLGFSPDGGELSAEEMRSTLDAHIDEQVSAEHFERESSFWATDGEAAFHALVYENDLPMPDRRSPGQVELCRKRAEGRLRQASEIVAKEHAKVSVDIDARTLIALPSETLKAAGDGVIVRVTDAAGVAEESGDDLARYLRELPALMLDGVAVARSAPLQKAVARAGSLEMIGLPREIFGEDPEAVLKAFQETLKLCAGHKVAVHVGSVDDAGAVQSLSGIDGLCLGGAAVWPELLRAD